LLIFNKSIASGSDVPPLGFSFGCAIKNVVTNTT
jgi:hypothetical protein